MGQETFLKNLKIFENIQNVEMARNGDILTWNLWKDKNGLLLRLLAISAVIFISTAVVSREYDL